MINIRQIITDTETPSRSLHIAHPTGTPLRRPASTLNAGRLQPDSEQEWTAARCHRLLRALKSRVAILSKEITRFSETIQDSEVRKVSKGLRFNRVVVDGEWTQTKKKVRQTYSNRSKQRTRCEAASSMPCAPLRKTRKSLLPGEVNVPTPVFARAWGEKNTTQLDRATSTESTRSKEHKCRLRARQGKVGADCGYGLAISGSLSQLRMTLSSSRYTIYEGIYNALEILLRSTAKDKLSGEERSRGAKSLLSVALRTIPKYISEQERLLGDQSEGRCAINPRDVCTEIYDELEAFGVTGRSWKELRTVVRSHGVGVVCEAIQSGLLDVDFSGMLVMLCVSVSAMNEAEALLTSLLCSSRFLGPKTIYDTTNRRLAILAKYVEHTGHRAFQYRQLSSLISSDYLPISWFATRESGLFWTSLIQSLSLESIDVDTRDFLEVALPSLALCQNLTQSGFTSSPNPGTMFVEATKNTFSSLVTVLSSLCILNKEARALGVDSISVSLEDYQISHLLQSCIAECRPSTRDINAELALLSMAIILVNPELEASGPTVSKYSSILLENASTKDSSCLDSSIRDDLVKLVSDIARCCGKGSATSEFAYLQNLHVTLEALASRSEIENISQSIIVDSAYAFAQKNPDRLHLEYAAGLDTKFSARSIKLVQNPKYDDGESVKIGFRWEEGIGEWVHATPAVTNLKRKAVELYPMGENENLETGTPLRRPSKLHRTSKGETLAYPDYIIASTGNEPPLWLVDRDSHQPVTPKDDGEVMDRPSPPLRSSRSVPDVEKSPLVESDIPRVYLVAIEEMSTDSPSKRARQAPRIKPNAVRASKKGKAVNKSGYLTRPPSQQSPADKSRACIRKARHRGSCSSQATQVFDVSDDELSLVSVSSQNSHTMQDAHMAVGFKVYTNRGKRPLAARQKQKKRLIASLDDSEDELCI